MEKNIAEVGVVCYDELRNAGKKWINKDIKDLAKADGISIKEAKNKYKTYINRWLIRFCLDKKSLK